MIYSLVETVKETGLDPYRYLLWAFETTPTMAVKNKDWAHRLVPAAAPEHGFVACELGEHKSDEALRASIADALDDFFCRRQTCNIF